MPVDAPSCFNSISWRRRSTRERGFILLAVALVLGGAGAAYVLFLPGSTQWTVAAVVVGLSAIALSVWVVWRLEAGAEEAQDPSEQVPKLVLAGVDLRDAALPDAKLEKTELTDAALAGANLNGAILESAWLTDSDLRGADLRGAKLSGADLRGTVIAGAKFTGATYDDETLWPNGTAPPEATHVKDKTANKK